MKQLFIIGDKVIIKSKNLPATITNDKSADICDGTESFVGSYECYYEDDDFSGFDWFEQDELTK